MVGIRRLYVALNKCGLQEYAYRILTNTGTPSYVDWLKDGATTLYEYWDVERKCSRNHHMYSDFMSWIMKTVVGIKADFGRVEIAPYFFEKLDWVKGRCGQVGVNWRRADGKILLKVEVPLQTQVIYKGEVLSAGTHHFEEICKS